MVIRVLCAVVLGAACCSIAAAEDCHALITSVKDGKVTFRRREKPKEGEKQAPFSNSEETLPANPDIKVMEGKLVRKRGEYLTLDPGVELPGGLANEQLKTALKKGRGVFARIITDEGSKKIKEVRVLFPRSPKKPVGESQPGPPSDPKVAASITYILMGMKDNRVRLRTGIFRAYGLYSEIANGKDDLRDSVEMYGAFDYPNGRLRLDRTRPVRYRLLPEDMKRERASKPWKVQQKKTQVVLTPVETLVTGENRAAVNVLSPARPGGAKGIEGQPFDVRCLGLYYWLAFDKYPSRFDQQFDILLKSSPHEVEQGADGRWKIVWMYPGPPRSQRTLWVDERKGFTVARSENRDEGGSSQPSGASVHWQSPTQISEVTWEANNGVWVPKTFKVQERTGDIVLSYDLSFEWESVNEPVSDSLFTIDGLGIKDRRLVIDRTTGQRVIARVLNDSPDNGTYYHTKEPRPRLLWIILVNLGIALALLLGFGYYFRRRSARKSAP